MALSLDPNLGLLKVLRNLRNRRRTPSRAGSLPHLIGVVHKSPVGASLLAMVSPRFSIIHPIKNPAHLSMCGVFLQAFEPYGAYVSSSSLGTLKSRDIMTLRAVMVKIENTNSLRAQTVSSTAL